MSLTVVITGFIVQVEHICIAACWNIKYVILGHGNFSRVGLHSTQNFIHISLGLNFILDYAKTQDC